MELKNKRSSCDNTRSTRQKISIVIKYFQLLKSSQRKRFTLTSSISWLTSQRNFLAHCFSRRFGFPQRRSVAGQYSMAVQFGRRHLGFCSWREWGLPCLYSPSWKLKEQQLTSYKCLQLSQDHKMALVSQRKSTLTQPISPFDGIKKLFPVSTQS